MDRVSNEVKDPKSRAVWLLLTISFFALCYSMSKLPDFEGPPPAFLFTDRTCITGGWKVALIATHVLAFILIPIAMKVFHISLSAMRFPQSSIFATLLGLSFIMVAIAAEIGWHVTQCWYYTNQYTVLNFLFYFFLLSAFALWSDGLLVTAKSMDVVINYIFVALLIIVSILYPVGASTNNGLYKLPIYLALIITFAVLTYRGYKILDSWSIILFPLFSVVVNLLFVWLLQTFGGNPYTSPNVASNAIYHIAHDLLGTEAGVLIFTVLIFLKGQKAKRKGEEQPLVDN